MRVVNANESNDYDAANRPIPRGAVKVRGVAATAATAVGTDSIALAISTANKPSFERRAPTDRRSALQIKKGPMPFSHRANR
jgi:hypothetical protein